MKDEYDFSNAKKNPYAEKIKKHGYIVRVQYDPDENDSCPNATNTDTDKSYQKAV
ncbi:MAG: hypothetical protein FWB96_03650 [Defluviitaleaceae bacterium]|nr:hypothetical protein [Defluviitaleaceae bacterium]MCL2262153.1 hypothetical protein [Defluviitaleaceae bacterium]